MIYQHNSRRYINVALPDEFKTWKTDVIRDLIKPDPDDPRELPMRLESGFKRRPIKTIMDRRWS